MDFATLHESRLTPRAEPPGAPSAMPPGAPRGPAAPRCLTVAGHELTVFIESPPLFEAMLRDIAAAQRSIWIEVYIFFNDAGGIRVAVALKQKAREGLDVRVLYDALGSNATPAKFFNDMIAAGVKVHAFHSLWEALRRFRPLTVLNRRDHRKLMVVDGQVAYFGGMNIIENVENVAQEKAQRKPASSGWRDVHIRMIGPQLPELVESFDRSWRRAHGEKVPRRPRAYRRAAMEAIGGPDIEVHTGPNITLGPPPESIPYAPGRAPEGAPGDIPANPRGRAALEGAEQESIRFFDTGLSIRYSRAARVYATLIRRAQESITISMAYFVPVGRLLRALLAARRRRVRLRVIVPGKSDVKIVQRATAYLYDKLLRRGFRIYERQQRMLHSKVMIVDDQWTVVGSCNLDPRSLYINLEFLAVIRSRTLAALMTEICRNEMAASRRIRIADTHLPWHTRLVDTLCWSFRWWL